MPNLFAQFSEDQLNALAQRHPKADQLTRMQWLDDVQRRVHDPEYRQSRNKVKAQ